MATQLSSALAFPPKFDVICKLDKRGFSHATDEGQVTDFASVVLHFVTVVLVEYKTLAAASKPIIQSVFTHPKLSA